MVAPIVGLYAQRVLGLAGHVHRSAVVQVVAPSVCLSVAGVLELGQHAHQSAVTVTPLNLDVWNAWFLAVVAMAQVEW